MSQQIDPDFLRPTRLDVIEQLVPIMKPIPQQILFVTCVEDGCYAGESACFVSPDRDCDELPMDELFRMPLELGATAVMVTSKSSGPLHELHERDMDYTRRLIAAGKDRGIEVVEHFLVEGDDFRMLSEHEGLWGAAQAS